MNVVRVKQNVRTSKWSVLHNHIRIGCELSDKQLACKIAKNVARLAGIADVCIEGATVEVINA